MKQREQRKEPTLEQLLDLFSGAGDDVKYGSLDSGQQQMLVQRFGRGVESLASSRVSTPGDLGRLYEDCGHELLRMAHAKRRLLLANAVPAEAADCQDEPRKLRQVVDAPAAGYVARKKKVIELVDLLPPEIVVNEILAYVTATILRDIRTIYSWDDDGISGYGEPSLRLFLDVGINERIQEHEQAWPLRDDYHSPRGGVPCAALEDEKKWSTIDTAFGGCSRGVSTRYRGEGCDPGPCRVSGYSDDETYRLDDRIEGTATCFSSAVPPLHVRSVWGYFKNDPMRRTWFLYRSLVVNGSHSWISDDENDGITILGTTSVGRHVVVPSQQLVSLFLLGAGLKTRVPLAPFRSLKTLVIERCLPNIGPSLSVSLPFDYIDAILSRRGMLPCLQRLEIRDERKSSAQYLKNSAKWALFPRLTHLQLISTNRELWRPAGSTKDREDRVSLKDSLFTTSGRSFARLRFLEVAINDDRIGGLAGHNFSSLRVLRVRSNAEAVSRVFEGTAFPQLQKLVIVSNSVDRIFGDFPQLHRLALLSGPRKLLDESFARSSFPVLEELILPATGSFVGVEEWNPLSNLRRVNFGVVGVGAAKALSRLLSTPNQIESLDIRCTGDESYRQELKDWNLFRVQSLAIVFGVRPYLKDNMAYRLIAVPPSGGGKRLLIEGPFLVSPLHSLLGPKTESVSLVRVSFEADRDLREVSKSMPALKHLSILAENSSTSSVAGFLPLRPNPGILAMISVPLRCLCGRIPLVDALTPTLRKASTPTQCPHPFVGFYSTHGRGKFTLCYAKVRTSDGGGVEIGSMEFPSVDPGKCSSLAAFVEALEGLKSRAGETRRAEMFGDF